MRTLLPITLPLLMMISCTKQGTGLSTETVRGVWELRVTQGGIIPPIIHKPGNGHLLVLTNQEFTVIDSGKVMSSGTYLIQHDAKVPSFCPTNATGVYDQLFMSPAPTTEPQFVELVDGELVIHSGCPVPFNSPVSTWQRIR